MNLRWLASPLVSCFHATEALMRKQALADAALATAMTDSAGRLEAVLVEEYIAPEVFLSHLVPLAAGIVGLHELAEVALVKSIGRTETTSRLQRVQLALIEVTTAFAAALPRLGETLPHAIDPLRRQWNDRGAGLLAAVADATEPEVVAPEAAVVLVHPALGGAGVAHLPYNVARIEAVPEDPVPQLPELVRLGWLLASLNLDLPRYGDKIHRDRLPLVAALAMIPITLTAAENIALARCDETSLRLAVNTWLTLADNNEGKRNAWAATVFEWHTVYRTLRPPFGAALGSLDVLLQEREMPS